MRSAILCIGLSLLIAVSAFPLITVQTGHEGPVTALQYDRSRDMLLSAGEDGTLRVWDRAEGILRRSIQVSRHPITELALHPSEPIAAVVSSGDGSTFMLSTWDWTEGRRIYRRRLAAEPLRLAYSPEGSYIVYTVPNFRSLRFLRASSGRALDYLDRGTGIVSYFAVSASERTIMVYVPSAGRIEYFDIRNNESIRELSTRENLERMQLLPGKRHAAAVDGELLTVVDVVTGEVIDTYPLGSRPTDMAVDATDGLLGALVDPPPSEQRQGRRNTGNEERSEHAQEEQEQEASREADSDEEAPGEESDDEGTAGDTSGPAGNADENASASAKRVRFFSFSGSFIYPRSRRPARFTEDASLIAFDNDYVFCAGRSGSVSYATASGRARVLAEDVTAPIGSLAVTDGTLHFSLPASVVHISSNIFGDRARNREPESVTDIRTRRTQVSLQSIRGIEAGEQQSVYVWGEPVRSFTLEAPRAAFVEIVPETRSTYQLGREEWPQIVQAERFNGSLLLLHNDGTFREVNAGTMATRFRYSALGMQTILGAGDRGIIVARNRTNEFESSLLQIDADTGETVLIPNDNFIVFDLAYDENRDRLYSLGLQRSRNGRTRTVLSVYWGEDFGNSRELLSIAGEDLTATAVVESRRGTVYTTLGTEGVYAIERNGNGREIEALSSIPRRLSVGQSFLYAINQDGTLSVWTLSDNTPLLTLTAFEDGSWAAVTASHRYYASSSRAERRLHYVNGGGFFSRDLADFRLALPARLR